MTIRTFTTRLSQRCAPSKGACLATCPHTVEQPGLSREALGDDGFEEALREKRQWLAENCVGDHVAEPLRSEGVITGRRFFFADPNDAFFFRMRF